jgi:large subunit ribosomal protein L12e
MTQDFMYLKVPVIIKVKGRACSIEVRPSVSNLIIKALKEPRRIKGRHYGDVSLDDLISIARIVRPRSLAATFEGTLYEVIGCAKAVVGTTVNGGMDALDLLAAIKSGQIEVPKE